MNITVIGTINRDTIHLYGGTRVESYGGILYNLVALASLLGDRVTLYPVCYLGADIQRTVLDRLRGFSNIDTSGIRIVQRKNNHAILTYATPTNRNEFLENRLPALSFEHIRPFLKSEFVLINFISGFDLSLSTLKRIRHRYRGKIFMDIHSLTLDIAPNGQRVPKCPDNWTQWVRQADICQLNLDEAQVLVGRALENDEEIAACAHQLIEIGPQMILITLGSRGSYLSSGSTSELVVEHFPAPGVDVVDTTGCGDVFSAGFIAEYIRSQDPVAASRFANRAAALNCTLSGLEPLHRLGEMTAGAEDRIPAVPGSRT